VTDERVARVAGLANAATYTEGVTAAYVDGAPHVKHPSLRTLYGELVVRVFDRARETSPEPRVLDLGAGEGSVTLPFLELGGRVTAVDISPSQLEALKRRCARFGARLETRCLDIHDALSSPDGAYDVVVVNSFLHHVPDYLSMIGRAAALLAPRGQFFSFQDPMRYDGLGSFTRSFGRLAYLSWRVRRGDVWGGLLRRLRRARGVYRPDSVHDNAEYHVTRNGVDQDAVRDFLSARGFECEVVRYFSTQSRLFQPLGELLGLKDTFSVLARKK
jgi:SAM-dependent methyltransferase